MLDTANDLQPKCVTLPELKAALWPFCFGWSWAEDAIQDLWKLGAPVPGSTNMVTRIIYPTQFRKWWAEVQQRMGIATPAEAIHAKIKGF
jgi:hypothetical protein